MRTEPTTATTSAKPPLRDWLLSEAPASPRQAFWGLWYRRARRFARNPLSMAGLLVLVLLLLLAIFAPWIATHDPLVQVLSDRLQPIGSDFSPVKA